MRRLAITAALLLSLDACGDAAEDPGTSLFTDQLTFGTGLDNVNFALTGEATTFTVGTGRTLYFRLESSANFAGRFVRLYFNDADPRDFAGCARADANICMTGFMATSTGTFEVKGYLVDATTEPAKESVVAARTITLN